ncbi:MAG: SMP-30/gluconolactonase/LRE family protein [Alphaproteobacteria bacterium]|nr:SMP-30/gluconolactonase/LRE family protein [Alphaproteobacteria bacterium]
MQRRSRERPSRRRVLTAAAGLGAAGLGAAGLGARVALAQAPAPPAAQTGTPASTITTPPRDWTPGRPSIYPDPDVIVIDPSFRALVPGNAPIQRLWTGAMWAEGPAWSSQGQYLVFSDVTGNTQYRYIWDDGRVTPFRRPSNNSNGNSFDFAGRQLSTEDFFRRVVRWEHDGSMTVIADAYQGKPLNSPNDLVPHPDGSIWFTDPAYGDRLSEGHPDEAGGPTNPGGQLKPGVGAPNAGALGGRKRELSTNVYRCDAGGNLAVVLSEEQLPDPNGLCFAPDYKTLYVISTGRGPGDVGPGGERVVYAFDVQGSGQGTALANKRLFSDMMLDGVKCGPDGMRADVFGNLWISSNAPLGYAGVLVFAPEGKLIGRIRLPEVCANLAFGGPKRDRLFMTASQSLYTLQLTTQGAAPG